MTDDGERPNLILTTNGRAPMKKSGDFATKKDVATFAENYAERVILPKVIEIIEFYMRQFPGMVDETVIRRLAEAFQANGLTLQGPTDGHTSCDAPDGARAQHADEPAEDGV